MVRQSAERCAEVPSGVRREKEAGGRREEGAIAPSGVRGCAERSAQGGRGKERRGET